MLHYNISANQVADTDISSLAMPRRDHTIEERNEHIHMFFMSPIADSYHRSRDELTREDATGSEQRDSNVHSYDEIPDFQHTEAFAENGTYYIPIFSSQQHSLHFTPEYENSMSY